MGQTVEMLDKSGLRDNTLLIWTCDQGTMWPHSRHSLYDAALRAPFIARWPGRIKPGTRTSALANFVDIVPTFIEAAGADVKKTVRGVRPANRSTAAA